MVKPRVLEEGHWIRKRRGTWIIAVPPEVRQLLRVTHRVRLYWTARRSGEAVLATKAKPTEGRLPIRQLARELMAARAEIEAIRQRDDRRDRGMYAEGYAHGYIQAREQLLHPLGRSAERSHRRTLFRWAFPEAAAAEDPKQLAPRPAPAPPRMNARTRRVKREVQAGTGQRRIETMPAPVLSPPASSEGADASGGAAPQASHLEQPTHAP